MHGTCITIKILSLIDWFVEYLYYASCRSNVIGAEWCLKMLWTVNRKEYIRENFMDYICTNKYSWAWTEALLVRQLGEIPVSVGALKWITRPHLQPRFRSTASWSLCHCMNAILILWCIKCSLFNVTFLTRGRWACCNAAYHGKQLQNERHLSKKILDYAYQQFELFSA